MMKNKNKIAVYIRLSLEDSKVESLSIQNQRTALHNHADSLFDSDYEVLEFVDNGYTGTNFERPAMQELLELVRNYKINCIIVKDFSRFGRNFIETSYFIEKVFPLYRVRFISINNNFDTSDFTGDIGGMEFAFQHLMNEYYSIDLSIKSKSAKYAKMRKGEYQSILCCYGYKKGKNGKLEIDEEAAKIVKMIFDMALEGKSNIQITKELYKRNIPTPGEYKRQNGKGGYDTSNCQHMWHSSAITRILTDERYIGTYVIGKRTVTEVGGTKMKLKDEKDWIKIPEHHAAIIDKEIYEKVQNVRRTFKCNKVNKNEYPLRGKVVCGSCNHKMSRAKRKEPYFYCRHTMVDETYPCHKLQISEKELQTLLFDIISKQASVLLGIEKTDDVKQLELKLNEETQYKNNIQKCYDDKLKLYEQYCLGEIDLEKYKTLKKECDNNLNQFENMYSNILLESEYLKSNKEKKAKLLEIASIILSKKELNRATIDVLIDKVLIFPKNHIEICWKLEDFVKASK